MQQVHKDEFPCCDDQSLQDKHKTQWSDSHIRRRPLAMHKFNLKNKIRPPQHTNSSFNGTSRLNISLHNRNMTEASVKTRKFTLRELDQMQRDVLILTNAKNELRFPEKGLSIGETSPTTYRRFQRCSFFDRDAIYHPKKQSSHDRLAQKEKNQMKQSSANWDYQEEGPMFTVPQGDVSTYMKTIVKTPQKKLSRFAIKLSQKIRSRFLKDIKEYNTNNLKADIELSKINNDSLWLDQFDDLKGKLINVEKNQQIKYRKSICGRSYDPYMQYLAMTKTQKRMVRKTYCFDVVSPKKIIS